jgi:hypothetical protein
MTDPRRPDQNAEFLLTVVVRPVYRLELSVIESPKFTVAGIPFTATFLLSNASNGVARIALRGRAIPFIHVHLDDSEIEMYPGEMREIHAMMSPGSEQAPQYRHAIELNAILVADTTVRARASTMVSVVPLSASQEVTFDVPLQVTARWSGENGAYGSQGELYGAGSFSSTNDDRYELLVRGPNNQTASFLGQRDEYRFAYSNRDLDVTIGDQPFYLTPLTELGRYAFGIRSAARISDFEVGGFVNQTRWNPTRWRQASGFATFNAGADSRVGMTYLHKSDYDTSDIATVSGNIRALGHAELNVEAGRSFTRTSNGNAYAIFLRGRTDAVQYVFNQIYAAPEYTGFYRDFDARLASVSVFPWRMFRIEGYYRDEERNLNREAAQLYAPGMKQYQAGIGYGNYVSGYVRVKNERDLLPVPKYDREEVSGLFRFGAYYENAFVVANVDIGKVQDGVLGRSFPMRRFALSSSFRPDADQGYSISVEYLSTKDLFSDEPRKGTSQNITAWYSLTRSLSFQLSLFRSWTISPFRQSSTLADAIVDYTFPFGHRISAQGRINHIDGDPQGDDVGYSLQYTVPLNIAFSKGPDGGALMGTVIDIETGEGIEGVFIYAGHFAAVTDGDGEYRFTSLPEGTHAITIDRGSIGMDRTTRTPFPVQIPIAAGQERKFDIVVTRSAHLEGTIGVAPDRGGLDTTTVWTALGGLIVELRSESERYRRVTDLKGRFAFPDVRPGTWTIHVEGTLPASVGQGVADRNVLLKPGEATVVAIDLRREQRTIRMLEPGGLLRPE